MHIIQSIPISLTAISVMASCSNYRVDVYEPLDKNQKTISMRVGPDYPSTVMAKELIKNGWSVQNIRQSTQPKTIKTRYYMYLQCEGREPDTDDFYRFMYDVSLYSVRPYHFAAYIADGKTRIWLMETRASDNAESFASKWVADINRNTK